MINQIANITGIQLLEALKPSEAVSSLKQLPEKNSLVEISVLGKLQNGYRLLIDGNVFQAKLPFSLNAGEFFFAKVIESYPFTLSLDNLFAHIGISEMKLSQLLSKLNIRNTDLSRQILKVIIEAKKPVIKSRLEKLADIIEKENLKLDDSQIQLLLQVLDSSDHGYEQMNGSFASLFQYSFNDLSSEILSYANDLKASSIPEYLKSEIDNALILHMTEDSLPDAVSIKNKVRSVNELIISLDAFSSQEFLSESLRSNTKGLLGALIKYTFLKANYQKAGIYKDFFIVETEGDLRISEYQFDRFGGKFSSDENTGFDLRMKPEELGEIHVDGYISGCNAKIGFTASDETASVLEASKDELTKDLINNARMNPIISFRSGNPSAGIDRHECQQGINVSV